mmetsp:Transcript_93092/g.258790  ORF Transcript_93092/g.258790 Transcript_93092/m.258790 type:complete len:200 (-) Transcript_93092:250-849(-)
MERGVCRPAATPDLFGLGAAHRRPGPRQRLARHWRLRAAGRHRHRVECPRRSSGALDPSATRAAAEARGLAMWQEVADGWLFGDLRVVRGVRAAGAQPPGIAGLERPDRGVPARRRAALDGQRGPLHLPRRGRPAATNAANRPKSQPLCALPERRPGLRRDQDPRHRVAHLLREAVAGGRPHEQCRRPLGLRPPRRRLR